MDELTQQGIAALKAGDRAAARQLLAAAVKQNQNNALAWLWLTGTLESDEERLTCLRQVLRIDPNNQAAARGISQILARTAQPEPLPPLKTQTTPVERIEASPAVQPAEMQPFETTNAIKASNAAVIKTAETEQAVPQTEAVLPVEDTAAGQPVTEMPGAESAPAKPARRGKARTAGERPIFRTRPSLVPALVCFWVFFFGAVALAALLSGVPEVGLPLAGIVGLLLEIIVVYVVIRNYTVRYELTSQQLTLRYRGKRAVIALGDILGAECSQSIFQQVFGTGNIEIEASINGQLTHLRMRNIAQCQQRTQQILSLVKERV